MFIKTTYSLVSRTFRVKRSSAKIGPKDIQATSITHPLSQQKEGLLVCPFDLSWQEFSSVGKDCCQNLFKVVKWEISATNCFFRLVYLGLWMDC